MLSDFLPEFLFLVGNSATVFKFRRIFSYYNRNKDNFFSYLAALTEHPGVGMTQHIKKAPKTKIHTESNLPVFGTATFAQ